MIEVQHARWVTLRAEDGRSRPCCDRDRKQQRISGAIRAIAGRRDSVQSASRPPADRWVLPPLQIPRPARPGLRAASRSGACSARPPRRWPGWSMTAAAETELMLSMPRRAPAGPSRSRIGWRAPPHRAARPCQPRTGREVGVHDQWPFLAIDRSAGVTLREWIADQSGAEPGCGGRWLCDALRGLAFAHEAAAAHGDMQLHHLLITRAGQRPPCGVRQRAERSARRLSAISAGRGMAIDTAALHGQRQSAERDVLACGLLCTLAHRRAAARTCRLRRGHRAAGAARRGRAAPGDRHADTGARRIACDRRPGDVAGGAPRYRSARTLLGA